MTTGNSVTKQQETRQAISVRCWMSPYLSGWRGPAAAGWRRRAGWPASPPGTGACWRCASDQWSSSPAGYRACRCSRSSVARCRPGPRSWRGAAVAWGAGSCSGGGRGGGVRGWMTAAGTCRRGRARSSAHGDSWWTAWHLQAHRV